MKLYIQFMIICLISLLGEALSVGLGLPVPGSILGLIILFVALQLKWVRLHQVNQVGNFLLANMTILFLPAAVGIMDKFDVIAPFLAQIGLILIIPLILNLVVIAWVVSYIKQRYEGDYPQGGSKHG